ncbi:MAG: DNA double-strand break repair nuclease NurA [Candidatus Aenigmarchaeota archaeon]|nr:DNA double-strand break repair nuclease NurA [Candidatus Aenigmarchaeota archaeon]
MDNFVQLTETLAKIISEMESNRRNVGNFLKESNEFTELTVDNEVIEKKIIHSTDAAELKGLKIAGIDGGLVKKSFHGIDLMLLRAVGVIYDYTDGNLKVEYYPNAIPAPIPRAINDPLDDLGFELNSNIERQITEINMAIEVLEKYEPDLLLLNGSVIPHYTFVPEKGSFVYVNYENMISAYNKLFDAVKSRKTILAGVIEDSRGTRFCEILSKAMNINFDPNIPPEFKIVLNHTKDTNLLAYTLNHGQRTFTFPYSSETESHPILRNFPAAKQIFTFYLRTAEFDRPLRVDFLADKGNVDTVNRISSILLALASNSSYGTPSVIVEADQRAKLSENDLEIFYHDILNKAGNIESLLQQRRNQRPF